MRRSARSTRRLQLVIVVCPHGSIDGSTKKLVLCRWQVSFADTEEQALAILQSGKDHRLIVTHATDVGELCRALQSIDGTQTLDYMIMLGPPGSGDVSLTELVKNC